MSQPRWDKLAEALTAAGIESSVSVQSYADGVSRSILIRHEHQLVEVHDKWSRKNASVWLGWQVHTEEISTSIVTRTWPVTKKRVDIVQVVRHAMELEEITEAKQMPDYDGDALDGERLIAQHYPKDGPHSPGSITSSGEAINELFRYLAHATSSGQRALPFASNGYQLLGNLSSAAGRQEQLYRQLARWADQLAADPKLRHCEHRRDEEPLSRAAAVEQAELAAQAFRTAAEQSTALVAALAAAHNAIAPLEHVEDGLQ